MTNTPRQSNASLRHDVPSRRGAILVWFVLVLPLLLGMTGLVIDTGLLMSNYRHVQNSVDAAAIAAANDLAAGKSSAEAIQTAIDFVHMHHGMSAANVEVHLPPQSGPYTGEPGFVEVIAEHQTATLFIHLLRGSHKSTTIKTRAVAGGERVESIDGIIALDPDARGLRVAGNAQLEATGRIIINSEGGGRDANGALVAGGSGPSAVFVSAAATLKATEVYVVGGVIGQNQMLNYEDGGPHPLKTGQLPVPDPFLRLPTPTVANGVVDVMRGAPQSTAAKMSLNNSEDNSGSPNEIITDASGEETMILRPGIYSSIRIVGGKVHFEPGIYVMATKPDTVFSVEIMGGEVDARGIMFYNTTEQYDPITGQPDIFDGEQAPSSGVEPVGRMRLNPSVGVFSAIDTFQYPYLQALPSISDFNGMLVYQRRSSSAQVQFLGFSDVGSVNGAIYAKWAQAKMTTWGPYNSQFVVGTFDVPGHGDLTIDYKTDDAPKTEHVFLVE